MYLWGNNDPILLSISRGAAQAPKVSWVGSKTPIWLKLLNYHLRHPWAGYWIVFNEYVPMRALLPPSSNKCLPNRPVTVIATLRPTGVLPVNETNLILLSSAIDWPISVPPWQREQMAPGNPFFSRTWAIILVVATDTKGVVGAPFQIIEFPQTMAMALFQP